MSRSTELTVALLLITFSYLITFSGLDVSGTGGQPEGWCEETRLSNIEGDRMPQICSNGSNIHVVWNGGEQSERINYTRSMDGGNTWDIDVQIPNLAGVVNGANAMAVDGDNIHLVYENSAMIMYVKSENNGETWSIPKTLTTPSADDGYASIAVNGSYVHVVYRTYFYTSEYYQIFYLRSMDNGDTWGNAQPISPQNELSRRYPDIAFGGNYLHVVWSEHDDAIPYTVSEVRYARSITNGEDWEESYALVPGNESARIPAIAVKESNVHVIWVFEREVYYKRSLDNGTTWFADTILSDESGADMFVGDIGVNKENVHIAWHDRRDDPALPEIYYKSSSNNGNSWDPDIRLTYLITNPEAPGSYEPQIAVSGNSIHVIWDVWEHEPNELHVYYMRTLPNIFPVSIQLSDNPTEDHLETINASIGNNGYADAYNVNVTCFINETFLASQIIDLLELNFPQTVQFQWVPLSSGNYNIRIEVDPNNASYEWDETDNNLSQDFYINAIPVASLNANPTTVYSGETVNFDALQSTDDGNIISYFFDFGDGSNSGWISLPSKSYSYQRSGTYIASLIVKDNNGIESTNAAEVLINVKNKPPSVEINYPTGGEVSGLVTITGTSSDIDGIVENVYVGIDSKVIWELATGTTSWSWDWDTTIYPDGDHTIYAKAYDGEDSSEIVFVSVVVDNGGNIAPQVGITHPNDGDTVSGEIEIRGTASDDDGFIQIVEIRIDNEVWIKATGTTNWKHNWDTLDYANGEHIIKARAEDDLGQYSKEKSITVIVSNGGNIPPSAEITSHSGGEVLNSVVNIKGTAVDHDGNLELVEIRIDEGNWDTVTGTTSWTFIWDTTTYSNGEHVVYVRAKDDVGEYSKIRSVTLIVDNGGNVPPIVNIISPTSGTVSGNITIRGTAHDLDGDETIESVQVKIDEWGYTDGTIEWSYSWDTTTLVDGNYTIYVRAFDGTDYSMIKSVEVYVDNPHKPILTITTEIPDVITGTITIEGTASDVDGKIIKIEIQIDEGEWKEVEGTTNWSYKLDTTKLSDGKHTLRIRVYDDEGEYYTEILNITVKNTSWVPWLILAIIIIIIAALLIMAIALKRRNPKSGAEPPRTEQVTQNGLQTFRCLNCNKVFETMQSDTTIQCPHCGVAGILNK